MTLLRPLLLSLVLLVGPWSAARADATLPERPNGAAIASANAAATDAGMEVLRAGGNAFDAAVAVSATLGLVEPESSGIGGGGFFLLRRASDGKVIFIDARERAPLAATRDMFIDPATGEPRPRQTIDGALAAAIPGLPAGLVHLSREYGRKSLTDSLAPAIRLARRGWTFGEKNAAMMGYRVSALQADAEAARLFLRDGAVPAIGTRMRNTDYAQVLEALARDGHDGFYRGSVAQNLLTGVRAAGGIWSERDLAEYRVVEREALVAQIRGHTVITAPPPSSGGIALIGVLHMLEGWNLPALSRPQRLHLQAEAMRRAYRDRAAYLGDPDFVEVPTALLASAAYAAGLRNTIHPDKATPSSLLPGVVPQERPDTTHFSIIDAEGNLIAVTQTVNLPYGNAVVAPGTGFLLNNEMDDFSIKPGVPNAFGLIGAAANAIEPGKRPLSSMTPTLMIGPDRISVLGTPGGSRIISMVVQSALALLEGQTAVQAAELPRMHHQYLPDAISVEPGALTAEETAALQAMGHTVTEESRSWGNMQIVTWNRRTGELEAGADPRWRNVGKGSTAEGSIFR